MDILQFLLFIAILHSSVAWDTEQLEVFDVVEDVKENFYIFLNVSKDASVIEIRSAFRFLSLKLHPDKNPGIDTSKEFRNLVSVYEILKSSTKRKYYNEVLEKGLPSWKSAIYYYRYVRKIGMMETCTILFIVITIGQYLVNWATYYEAKLTIEENFRKKKLSKKGKIVGEEMKIDFPKPSFFDTLPFQIPRLIWKIIIFFPFILGFIKSTMTLHIKAAKTLEAEQEPIRIKTARRRNKFVVPEGPSIRLSTTGTVNDCDVQLSATPSIVGSLWTDDDFNELIRLVKKFPPGTSRRWENIAEALRKSVSEVTFMSNKMKENRYRILSQTENIVSDINFKVKTIKEVNTNELATKWNQSQQKAFEEALIKNPKGITERWDKIANHVPGKTKEECIFRFKYLAENLKKEKEPSIHPSKT